MAKFYVVWVGRQPGIYANWKECEAQVKGVAAKFMAFENRAQAEAAFKGKPEEFIGKKPVAATVAANPFHQPKPHSLAVDAACSGNPGELEYRCVRVDSKEELFLHGPFARGTNNIGEFLAVVAALKYCHENRVQHFIYSDSKIALNWVKAGKCRTKLDEMDDALRTLIERAEEWLAAHPPTPGQLHHWDTKAWGENPADFGRK